MWPSSCNAHVTPGFIVDWSDKLRGLSRHRRFLLLGHFLTEVIMTPKELLSLKPERKSDADSVA